MIRKKGITLVEVLMATVIFMFVALGSMYFFGAGAKEGMKAKHTSFALGLAEQSLETFKTWGYDSLDAIATTAAPLIIPKYGLQFSRQYDVTTDAEGFRVLCASVTWIDSNGDNRSIGLYTIMSPGD